MFISEKIVNKKKIYYKIIIILSFIISWASIGTNNSDLFILTTNANEGVTLKSIINFFRITLNLSCCIDKYKTIINADWNQRVTNSAIDPPT